MCLGGLSDVLVPLRIDDWRICEVDTQIDVEHNVPMRLSLGNFVALSEFVANDAHVDINSGEVFSLFPRDKGIPRFHFAQYIHQGTRWSMLGIGLGSTVVKDTESVAVLKNTLDESAGDLALHSRYETFLESCVPGTVLNGSMIYDSHQVSVELGSSSRSSLSSVSAPVRGLWLRTEQYYSSPFSVPRVTYEEIVSTMKRHGVADSDSGWMGSCSRDILDSMPIIQFRFAHGDGSAVISVYPRDYIIFGYRSSCRLLISASEESLWIDPLRIAHMNMRITNDGTFQLCRSAYTGSLAAAEGGPASTSRVSTMVVTNAPLAPVIAPATTLLPSAEARVEPPIAPAAPMRVGRVRRFMGHLRRLVRGEHRYEKLHNE